MQSIDMQAEPAENNEPARAPDFLDAEALAARHGAALRSIASIILDDSATAEKAVSDLLAQTCSEPLATPDATSRRHLSRQLYLNCTLAKLAPGLAGHRRSVGVYDDTVSKLGELSEQQRAAIALSFYGAHNYLQLAELMQLETPVVLNLMRSGLDELRR